MTRCGVVCLLLGSLSWSQATSSKSALAAPKPAAQSATASKVSVPDVSQPGGASNVAPNTPVITISGLCDTESRPESAPSDCKTVITRAQFEKVIAAIEPDMPPRARREFAERYANALVMSKKAEHMGLDKGPNYEEQMKVARIEVLSQDLKRVIQQKMVEVSEKDIEDYYHANIAKFEKAEVDRIYIPKPHQLPMSPDKKLSDDNSQPRSQSSEQMMKEEADNLHTRAVAGEEFAKLQADAYQMAGIKSAASNTTISIRRISLPPNQAPIMDLRSGEVSPVFADPNEYVIYKIRSKDTLPLDQAREEIKATLTSQRMQDEMRRIQDAAVPVFDESYFSHGRKPESTIRPSEPAQAATPHTSNSNP